MNNSGWITDRLPTRKETKEDYGFVWVTIGEDVVRKHWQDVKPGEPWKLSWGKPEPYQNREERP
jgi:hypothetical protein